ncbi:hypothetical protein [Pseudoalteromonas sp. C12FD-1]|uniref:hypothetical protein n=1 Tax=Pseudoalteromonas sp. C12FD-1 TaxID=3131979 RepID=UPI00307F2A2E
MSYTSLRNSTTMTSMLVVGAISFNTYGAVDIDKIIESQHQEVYESNDKGSAWSSVGKKLSTVEKHDLVSLSDIIKQIKIGIGLPNKDVARIFDVSRQTLHSYQNQSLEQRVANTATRERAKELHDIMLQLQSKFEYSPGAVAKNYTMNGKSLVDLLSEQKLDHNSIYKFADKIAEILVSQNTNLSETNEVSLRQLTKSA